MEKPFTRGALCATGELTSFQSGECLLKGGERTPVAEMPVAEMKMQKYERGEESAGKEGADTAWRRDDQYHTIVVYLSWEGKCVREESEKDARREPEENKRPLTPRSIPAPRRPVGFIYPGPRSRSLLVKNF